MRISKGKGTDGVLFQKTAYPSISCRFEDRQEIVNKQDYIQKRKEIEAGLETQFS